MTKKKVKTELPKCLFAKWEDSGDGEWWLSAAEKEDSLTSTTEEFVGVYELKEVHAVKLVTTTRLVSKKVDT